MASRRWLQSQSRPLHPRRLDQCRWRWLRVKLTRYDSVFEGEWWPPPLPSSDATRPEVAASPTVPLLKQTGWRLGRYGQLLSATGQRPVPSGNIVRAEHLVLCQL